ncbi:hypothetical protein BI335_19100 [Enemella evansiae]|nr:hypothetical protein BI335_19100 [Enemella evansiae]
MGGCAVDDDALFELATRNRLLAADLFDGLSADQWATPSLCAGWTVREVAAHLVPPVDGMSVWSLLGTVVRYRGDLNRMVDETTREEARRPTSELVQNLRDRAGVRLKPPVTGAAGPATDTVIHLRDAARPLGLAATPPDADWQATLDFLVSRPARRGFLPKDRLVGLRLVTDDGAWSSGMGTPISGSPEALAMAISGRTVYLTELTGPGVAILRNRL